MYPFPDLSVRSPCFILVARELFTYELIFYHVVIKKITIDVQGSDK